MFSKLNESMFPVIRDFFVYIVFKHLETTVHINQQKTPQTSPSITFSPGLMEAKEFRSTSGLDWWLNSEVCGNRLR